MNAKAALALIREGESLTVEFKRHFSEFEKIAKEMIGFANMKGGFIFFGIDDDGSVYGVQSEKGEAELIKDCAENYCEPPIDYKLHYVEIFGKEIVAAEIFEAEIKPVRVQDYEQKLDLNTAQVYVRVKDKTVPASKETIKILQANAEKKALKNYRIGKTEKIVFEYLDAHERINVKELSNVANISYRRASRALIKLVRANLLIIHTKENGEEFFTYMGE